MENPTVVRVNGEAREVPGGTTLTALLALLGSEPRLCAIELNGDVVPRARFAEVALRDGDAVEIVTFVGGG